ncbi:hypothetical protein ACMD2_08383 [Ananas comosus]|uniref:NAD(P)-binding domain-containing protein n=1 Tax=Ananas comosus TaxID=4615 RepID=A0A199W381_ANACO|nr:hypothetical protein ACMD2_08383 [Ananas comosus]
MAAIRGAPFQFPPPPPASVGRRRRIPAAAMSGSGAGANHRMLVLGTGFVGSYASERLIEEDDAEWQVSGTCTSAAKRRELEKIGMDAFIFDATKSKLTELHTLEHATHLLISIPTIAGIGDPAIKASFKVPSSGRIYNVVDDDPVPQAEVFAFARNLLESRFPDMAKEFGDVSLPDLISTEEKTHGDKRVLNARLKNELGVRLLYPTYRSGLQSIFDSWSVDNY